MSLRATVSVLESALLAYLLSAAVLAADKENPFDNPFWYSSRTIQSGDYTIGTNKIIIDRESEKASKPQIVLSKNVHLHNGILSILNGALKAQRGSFENVFIEMDLGGTSEFVESVFNGCSFKKGGWWFVSKYSAKFRFSNCVFTDGFFESWNVQDIGVKAEYCTFVETKFGKFQWKWGNLLADPAKEQDSNEFYFRNCLFRRCSIPESVLIACRSSVFEECMFTQEDDLVAGKTFRVCNSLRRHNDSYIPKTTAKGKVEFLFDQKLSSKVGADEQLIHELLVTPPTPPNH